MTHTPVRSARIAEFSDLCTYGNSVDGRPKAEIIWVEPLPSGAELYDVVNSTLIDRDYVPETGSSPAFAKRAIHEGQAGMAYRRMAGDVEFRIWVTRWDRRREFLNGAVFDRGTLNIQVLVDPDHC